jgi:hypothetical protein
LVMGLRRQLRKTISLPERGIYQMQIEYEESKKNFTLTYWTQIKRTS